MYHTLYTIPISYLYISSIQLYTSGGETKLGFNQKPVTLPGIVRIALDLYSTIRWCIRLFSLAHLRICVTQRVVVHQELNPSNVVVRFVYHVLLTLQFYIFTSHSFTFTLLYFYPFLSLSLYFFLTTTGIRITLYALLSSHYVPFILFQIHLFLYF